MVYKDILLRNYPFNTKANESTFIPKETIHSLENEGSEQFELIEVQLRDYLEEGDLVRFEDKYGRF